MAVIRPLCILIFVASETISGSVVNRSMPTSASSGFSGDRRRTRSASASNTWSPIISANGSFANGLFIEVSRCKDRTSILEMPVLVDVKAQDQARGCTRKRQRAHGIGVVSQHDVRLSNAGPACGRQRADQKRGAGDGRQKFGVRRPVAESIAVAGGENDSPVNEARA